MVSFFIEQGWQKVYFCLKNHLKLEFNEVPINYYEPIDYFKIVRENFEKKLDYPKDRDFLNSKSKHLCELMPGFFKSDARGIIIKKEEMLDFGLLMAELIHSKSITRNKYYIQDWLREGLPHYLAMILCQKCGIKYKESGHDFYFLLWEKVHREFGFDILVRILFSFDLEGTKAYLKVVLRYKGQADILVITLNEALDSFSKFKSYNLL